ncbi:MAG TPA: hypothetical protein VNV42_00380 [Solirubrobacteraceae bacterium]|jgi:hypothetical protein|nr:hypothetical protein [Solirubrobacteraceae bacterium]
MAIEQRKAAELSAKLTSVSGELAQWRRQSEEASPLEKHHTQIRAVANTLETFAAEIEDRLRLAVESSTLLVRASSLELTILELHRIWEFFRSKFALRYVPWFSSHLLAADDLAWSCYRPIQAWVEEAAAREPPLVFFNGGSSPLTLPRGAAYSAEEVPGEALGTAQFQAALAHLPVPVIGIPWFQLQHLPEVVLIAHEAGHDVEADLGLTAELHAVLEVALADARVDESRRVAWHAWLGEVFADLYGALATGPAYVATLIDFLAGDVRSVTNEAPGEQRWGEYPTRTLRVLLTAAVVERVGLAEQADELRERWREAYRRHALSAFEDDVPVVVAALLDGPYERLGGGGLEQLVSFGPAQQAQARAAAGEALDGCAPLAEDVRVLAAAARLAFDHSPENYARNGVADRILRQIENVQRVGTRAGAGASVDGRPSERQRDGRDIAAGRKLFSFVSQAHHRADAQKETSNV